MIVINSGAYVVREFQVEFGRIPPALLPLANRQLIEHQLEALRTIRQAGERMVLSLPQSYRLSASEGHWLHEHGIPVASVPDELGLAESLLFVLNTSRCDEETVRLLHGDTLIADPPSGLDLIGVAESSDDYAWEVEHSADDSDLVWCGFFSFSSARQLTASLATARGDFVCAVRDYGVHHAQRLQRIEQWYDLGHVNTYFSSRARFSTARAFNRLAIASGTVVKSGDPAEKILAEGQWFSSLPPALRKFAPQLIDSGKRGRQRFYELEYLPLVPLNEVFVHGRNALPYWIKIFERLRGFLVAAREAGPEPRQRAAVMADAAGLYGDKTIARLEQYARQSGRNLDVPCKYQARQYPSLREIARICGAKATSLPVVAAVIHGDFCLSNILFDSRGDAVKLIDPRGLSASGKATPFGDQKYDVAKLAHSIVGLYDFIIAGRYRLDFSEQEGYCLSFDINDRLRAIQQRFLGTGFLEQLSVAQFQPLLVLLFLSMLALHSDRPDRQEAMLANALRLYAQMDAAEAG